MEENLPTLLLGGIFLITIGCVWIWPQVIKAVLQNIAIVEGRTCKITSLTIFSNQLIAIGMTVLGIILIIFHYFLFRF